SIYLRIFHSVKHPKLRSSVLTRKNPSIYLRIFHSVKHPKLRSCCVSDRLLPIYQENFSFSETPKIEKYPPQKNLSIYLAKIFHSLKHQKKWRRKKILGLHSATRSDIINLVGVCSPIH
ncbi:MAG: hypothetical protein VKJ25_07060, partial [Okeania sp.]|nr:hypothetical protein [Okeania sp.]